RRVQQNQTFNNAPVPVERRGNLWFLKGTAELRQNHRLQVSFQYDRTIQANAIFRGAIGPSRSLGVSTSSTSSGVSSSTPQITAASAFGTLIKGGPLASFNYNWV